MGYGKQLHAYGIPEWKAKYIKYVQHKKWLRANIPSGAPATERKKGNKGLIKHLSVKFDNGITKSSNAFNSVRSSIFHNGDSTTASIRDDDMYADINEPKNVFAEFNARIDNDVSMIEIHFKSEINVFADRLIQIKHELDVIDEKLGTSKRTHHMTDGESSIDEEDDTIDPPEVDVEDSSPSQISPPTDISAHERDELENRKERLAKTIITVWDCSEKLEDYQKMNIIGAAKLFQKRDIIWGMGNASADFMPFRRRFAALFVPEEIQLLMHELHRRARKEDGMDFEEALHVQRAFFKESASVDQDDSLTYYFLGVLTVLIADVIALTIMSPTNPAFDLTMAFVWVMPVWRLSFVCCFFTWCLAFVISIWERYLVNYKFIMNIDPDCTLDSTDMVGLASVQTTVWSIGMIAFLADYKFNMFGSNSPWGIHAIIQLVFQFIVIPLWPAHEFRYEYRLSVLSAMLTSVKAIFKVPRKTTFWVTLVADMLTSLVKPMCDIYMIFAIFCSGENFLSPTTSTVDIPFKSTATALLAISPLWIRIQQTREKINSHIDNKTVVTSCHVNIIKFCCSIAVVVVTNLTLDRWLSPYTTRLSWVVTYITASVIALYWDMNKDWGLAANPDSFLREGERIMFPQYIYMNVVMIDVFGRLTWALTLMPARVLGSSVIIQQSVVTVTTLIEIIRRHAWFLVKIEHEHLTNSNKHRALLWVPKVQVHNDDSLKELHNHFAKPQREITPVK